MRGLLRASQPAFACRRVRSPGLQPLQNVFLSPRAVFGGGLHRPLSGFLAKPAFVVDDIDHGRLTQLNAVIVGRLRASVGLQYQDVVR